MVRVKHPPQLLRESPGPRPLPEARVPQVVGARAMAPVPEDQRAPVESETTRFPSLWIAKDAPGWPPVAVDHTAQPPAS